MATIANLGNGTGLIYVTLASGTTVVSVLDNTSANVVSVVSSGKVNKGVANHADGAGLNENNFRYFLDDDSGADAQDLSGALEITNLIVGRGFEGEFPRVAGNALNIGGDITLPRVGNLQFVFVRENTSADLEIENLLASDKFVVGDCVILRYGAPLASVSINTLTVKDGVGNIRLIGGDFILSHDIAMGYEHIMLRWDGTNWHEVFRNPISGIPSVQQARTNGFSVNGNDHTTSTITSGGGIVVNPNTQGRYITLTSPSSVTLNEDFEVSASDAKAGDFYFVRVDATYVTSGGDIKLFGTDLLTVAPLNTKDGNVANILCLYDGDTWNFTCTVDVDRYNLDLDELRVQKYIKTTYDFAINTGATGTYTIGDNVIPQDAIVDLENAIIVTRVALTSAGAAEVSIGLDADADAIDGFRRFAAAPYSAVRSSAKAQPTISGKSFVAASPTDVTFTISTAALTAGRVDIYIPYTNG